MTLPASGPLSLNDIQTEFGGTNPIGMNEYYAGGGLVPAGTTGTFGAVPSSGALSVQNFYGTSNYIPVYIEEVFSTFLYTGNSSSSGPTISNGLDLLGKGGMVWTKSRSVSNSGHMLFDTVRGGNSLLTTSGDNSYLGGTGAAAAVTYGFNLRNFLSNGFNISNTTSAVDNQSGNTYASWTFREQPKFFDVVTYTGGISDVIQHNLGSVPGFIMVKRTDTTGSWLVYHRSEGASRYLVLNSNGEASTGDGGWGGVAPTATTFNVGFFSDVNASGGTYVAYLFAHNAGGFGLTGTDNVITCGRYTGNGTVPGPTIDLGFEPQWLMIKRASGGIGDWLVIDNLRGMPVNLSDAILRPNLSSVETSVQYISPTATGFEIRDSGSVVNGNTSTYIYIAIRRGPMKVPTTGTSVFTPLARSGTGENATVTAGFPVDLALTGNRGAVTRFGAVARLTNNQYLVTMTTQSGQISATAYQANTFDSQIGVNLGTTSTLTNDGAVSFINYMMARASGFMDVVCYTGTGSATTVAHNLAAVPELMIVKKRSGADAWQVYSSALANTEYVVLNTTAAKATGATRWNSTTPTSTVFSLGTASEVNTSAATYVAYLFASCPGVSKVFSYTGNGSSQTINCGFTGGARFVLIKRTDSSGDWYVWDSARGIVSGNDPYITFNSASAEITTNDSVDADSTGFVVNQVAATNVNVSSATYIGLAIA